MGKLGELVELCHELNSEDFSVFFDYSGHVSSFTLRVYMGGWVEGSQGMSFGYLEGVGGADGAIFWLKKRHEQNKRLLINRAQQAERDAKALEEAKALLTPEQIKIIKELA